MHLAVYIKVFSVNGRQSDLGVKGQRAPGDACFQKLGFLKPLYIISQGHSGISNDLTSVDKA